MSDEEELDKRSMLLYEYEWDISFNLPDIQSTIEPLKINTVQKIMNFHSSFCSFYHVHCIMSDIYSVLIRENRDKVTVSATLTMNLKEVGGETGASIETAEVIESVVITDDVFIPLFADNSFDNELREEDVIPEEIDLSKENMGLEEDDEPSLIRFGGKTSIVEFTMYPMNTLNTRKPIINHILKDCKVGTALLLISNKANVDKYIIDKPHNQSTISELKLLPYDLIDSLKSLQIRYGIYKEGVIAYIDDKTLYILKKYAVEHEYEEEDTPYSFVTVPFASSKFENVTGARYENDDGEIEYIQNILFNIQDNSLLTGETIGDSVLFTSYTLGHLCMSYSDNELKEFDYPISMFERPTKTHEASGMKIGLEYDELNNPYNLVAHLLEQNITTYRTFVLYGADIRNFKPNKHMSLKFLDETREKTYGGRYMFSSVICNFKSLPGDVSNKMVMNAKVTGIHEGMAEYDDSGISYEKDLNMTSAEKAVLFNKDTEGESVNERLESLRENAFNDEANIEEIEKTEDTITIDVTRGKKYYSQRDNIHLPDITCNLTSTAMGLFYMGINTGAPSSMQPEDYLWEMMGKSRIVDQMIKQPEYSWVKTASGGYYVEKDEKGRYKHVGQIQDLRVAFINELLGREATNIAYLSMEEVLYEFVQGRPIVFSGKFPIKLGNRTSRIGHIVCGIGFLTNQQDIREVKSPNDINIKEVVGVIVNDPYGKSTTKYKNKTGSHDEIPMKNFIKWIRPENRMTKSCQVFKG